MTKQEADEIFFHKGGAVFDLFDDYITVEDYERAIDYYARVTGCEIEIAWEAVLDYIKRLNRIMPDIPIPDIPIPDVPRCPTCNSTNVKKISATSKVPVLWKIISRKKKKTFHCNNCGYEW